MNSRSSPLGFKSRGLIESAAFQPGPLRSRRYHRIVILLAAILLFIFVAKCLDLFLQWPEYQQTLAVSVEAANSTLGFGILLGVSGPGSTRRGNLIETANLTMIDVTIPEIPPITEDDEIEFRQNAPSNISTGSLRAWLSHRHVLKEFLNSGAETALLLEDDVDWDARLRSVQIPRFAAAARTAFREPQPTNYYGDLSQWDLIWVGHCGDYFIPIEEGVGVGHIFPSDLTEASPTLYDDPTVPGKNDLHPFTASQIEAFEVAPRTRFLHRAQRPLCSFAYAVTRAGAKTILNSVAPQKAITFAFDFAMMKGCKHGTIKCWSLTPELFHHYPGASIIGKLDNHPFLPPVDKAGLDQVKARNRTANIECGLWAPGFDWELCPEREEFKEQARLGHCLKLW